MDTDILRWQEKSAHRFLVMNHETIKAPVAHFAIWVFRDVRVPRSQVWSPIPLVKNGSREGMQVDLITYQNVLLAWAIFDNDWLYRFRYAPDIFLNDFHR